jgi:hypothetical protein
LERANESEKMEVIEEKGQNFDFKSTI